MLWTPISLQLGAAALGLIVFYAYVVRLERRAFGLVPSTNARWGPLWPLVDVFRALFRRGALAPGASRLVCSVGAWIAFLASLSAVALLTWASVARLGDITAPVLAVPWANLITILCLMGLGLLGTLLRGWGDGRAYVWEASLAVARRGLAFSVPALLSLIGVAMIASSLNPRTAIEAQVRSLPFVVYQPLALVVFALSLLVAGRRLPYRLPGCRDALLSDFHLQHSGGSLALCHWAEYLNVLLAGVLVSVLYGSGSAGPWRHGLHWLLLKAMVVSLALLWVRDAWLVDLARRAGHALWLLLTLLALGNALLTGAALTLGWWS